MSSESPDHKDQHKATNGKGQYDKVTDILDGFE